MKALPTDPSWHYSMAHCEELLRLDQRGMKQLYGTAMGHKVPVVRTRKPRAKPVDKVMAAGA